MKGAIEWFDTDGDGTLSDIEKEAMKSAMEARKVKVLAAFDADSDGTLSDTERQAAREAGKAKRKEIKAAMLTEFDTDNDGKLSKEEKSGVIAWAKANYPDNIPFPLGGKGDRKGKGDKGGKKALKLSNQL